MEDRDFFDLLHQQWAKTTGAENMYWASEEYKDGTGRWKVYAVKVDEEGNETKKLIASELQNEADADFIAAVHGCLPDLTRRLHMALDEADRADYDRDSRECRLAELELENAELLRELGRG
ncbi:hypothetical protein ROCKSTAR_41 [Mycobacterium phage Rockstar]|uniref:Uncharacterized protein n=4 Tax=Veracruzvirus TaxID=2948946 RepID=A0A6M3T179_9CAUD|nr:hypothetical protein M614_gp39 [Mycobacterium phage BTCU-1]YP_009614558.1 hypothetical protein FDI65_gp45 [Mycobacterium phage Rockstar]QGJ97322.1 hypothetical protein PBI_ISCA_40 [Mycobacterium phage Isca]QJD52016.1 hypothetical protein PBI_MK4_41 [Mycobacterium phage MK4]QJD52175.1 hypothetical protein PBI_JF4_41 [Mycobacterium phage JF4]QJD52255.1 hypothetical protein PBI_JF2_41 [Mycobacterium phage JF2]BBC53759.1 hypothetical protein [Mycobacterium phage B1]